VGRLAVPQPGAATSLDAQAAEFERRVGLPDEVCREIATAALGLAGARAGDLVVEIGAGTGMIGRWFPEHRVRYVGLDLSRGMLEVFRRRQRAAGDDGPAAGAVPAQAEGAGRAAGAALVQADAGSAWPLAGGAARLVFSSRAIHLLPVEVVVEELFRAGAPDGAACLLGWVERRPESLKARMSREMRRRLRGRGFTPRAAGGQPVLEACRARGAEELPRTAVARWPARHTPRQALDDWRSKLGLGGIVLPPGVQEEVLAELAAWAAEVFGGLDAGAESEECYVLEGVRFTQALQWSS